MDKNKEKKGAKFGRRPRKEKSEFEQKLLDLARVTRVVKGGRRFRFRATLVIGDRKGRVGVGVAKGADVSDAISKAFNDAKKQVITVSLVKGTLPHDVYFKQGSAKVLLKPATKGRGVVAGGAVRAVMELAGVHDVVSKSLGTSNKLNVARAAIEALKQLRIVPMRKVSVKK
jgi:small subunit ribosomal protein S5